MAEKGTYEWSSRVGVVKIGATKSEGGTRGKSYTIGGSSNIPFFSEKNPPRIALEICDDIAFWPGLLKDNLPDITADVSEWAKKGEMEWGADLIRVYLTSTKKKHFSDFPGIKKVIDEILSGTTLPLIIEGSDSPEIDSDVFLNCGEAGSGERLLLGTAEADRYRSVAAAAIAYNHAVIAQSPIDINLAKQLNILLRETGMPDNSIIIDSYTGALGYGFEYSYSTIERIRYAALKGDDDLAMPIISSAPDTLGVREVRESPPETKYETAIQWEFGTALSSLVAGASIVCVRLPETIKLLKTAIIDLSSPSVEDI